MTSLLKDEKLLLCTGCGACVQACVKSCIRMQVNSEGFCYPIIDEEKCIACKKCEKSCQVINAIKRNSPQASYCALAKGEEIWKRTASGGAASIIAKWGIERHGAIVFGCEMDEKQCVQHIGIEMPADIKRIAGSKYVESNLGDAYKNIMSFLKKGQKCIFLGTPCQVAGLKNFLMVSNVSDTNLLTVDNVCHGVPSPLFWQKAVEYYKKISTSKIKQIRFRKKVGIPKAKSIYFLDITFTNGKKKGVPRECDAYYNLFMKGATFRESCYRCQYADINRCADLTVGDCDSSYLYRKLKGYKAKSIVMINTEKGFNVWEDIKSAFNFCVLNLEVEKNMNHQLEYPSEYKELRDTIYNDVFSLSYEELNKKYAENFTLRKKMGHFLEKKLPAKLYSSILKLIG